MSIDELKDYDIPTGETQDGDGLPRIWWKYGNQAAKLPGFFYARGDDFDGPLSLPWEEAEVHDGELGYKAETLLILPITKRSQPYTKDKDTNRRTYFDRWSEGMQIHTELICFVEGIEGPVVFSYHGVTGRAMDGKGDGIIPAASRLLANEAARLFKKKVGLSAFWLPIGPRLNTQGKVDFQKLTQGSVVNPPALRLPAGKEGKDLLDACYAGRETIEAAAAVRAQFEAWRQERRANEPAPVPAGDGRNVPQPIEDDEGVI
jgi:hypothetical protein